MKIALFSDIHANLPALESCLADIDSRKVDVVYCLGDLVGYNIWPNEVINEIRKRNIPTLAGNYDFGIGRMSDDCGCAYKTDHEKSNGAQSIEYTNSIVKPDERKYLRALPSHIRLEYQLNDEKFDFLMVHGSPRKINEYLFVDRDEKSMLRIMEQANAHFLFFGHTHKPYHKTLKDENGNLRHAINIGSVGKPKDGDPRGGYVLISLDENFSLAKPDSFQVEFIRFAYDVEKAARAVEDSPLPNEYADMLRKAY
ncbi:MAG: metallophosphoesterase family protein [Cyclobacteriaceae bacterium]|nr:metallophosphoesterase family protein [Cyclobacteriaceae bacterium]